MVLVMVVVVTDAKGAYIIRMMATTTTTTTTMMKNKHIPRCLNDVDDETDDDRYARNVVDG